MRPNRITVFAVLVVVVLLAACDAFGSSNQNVRPTPTLPLATPILVEPTTVVITPVPAVQTGSLGGRVFDDQNGNGGREDSEPTIAGVHVSLSSGACGSPVTARAVSGAGEPSYLFEGLAAGDYCISIDPKQEQNVAVLQTGAWTYPTLGNNVAEGAVPLQAGQQQTNLDFGWKYLSPEPTAPAVTAEPTMLPTPTAVSTNPTSVPPPACTFKAQYVADVTIADNSIVAPGQQFTKTWRLKNTGTCAWGPGTELHQIVFVGGDQLGAQPTVELPNVTAAGAEGDISIPMVAPTQAGRYQSDWKLRTNNGVLVGVGATGVALFVKIIIQAATPPTAVPPPPTGAPPPISNVIQFTAGATEAEVQGTLPANGSANYLINVQAQQTMILALSSNSSSARVSVLGPTGAPQPAQRDNPEGTYWLGVLPATGNYAILVSAGNATPTANFSLSVVVPQRITFAPGAVSAAVAGMTSQGRIVTYLLKANSGQRMIARLNVPTDAAGLTIYGLDDGQPLVRSQSGATDFDGTLPGTQDYVIQVVPLGQGAVNFSLQVTVR